MLYLVRDNNVEYMWVLINHCYENKISSVYMLPFFLMRNEQAFKAFAQLTGNMRDKSIEVLADSDEAMDCIMSVLEGPGILCKLALQIVSNMLGEGEGHWKYFYYNKLLDKSLNLLLVADGALR